MGSPADTIAAAFEHTRTRCGNDLCDAVHKLFQLDYHEFQKLCVQSFTPFYEALPEPYFPVHFWRSWRERNREEQRYVQISGSLFALNRCLTERELEIEPGLDISKIVPLIQRDNIVVPEVYYPVRPRDIIHIPIAELYFVLRTLNIDGRLFFIGHTDGIFILPKEHWKYQNLIEEGVDVGALLPIPLTQKDRRIAGVPEINLSDIMLQGVENLVAGIAEQHDATPIATFGYQASKGSRLLARRRGYLPLHAHGDSIAMLPDELVTRHLQLFSDENRGVKFL